MKNKNLIQGKTGPWEVVIGLEVHAQVMSNSKLFSGASTAFGADPNAQVSFIDAGFPGMLPVINEVCVHQAVRTGLGLNAQINAVSVFDRKNYFYPDLPQGYQISQFKDPIVGEGYLDIDLDEEGHTKRIGITRVHLEQDAGKSIHDQNPTKSYIDLNRSGVALMEIVTEPDMRSAEEAKAFVRKLRALLRCLKTCDGNMEQGSLRADVNVSLRRPGEDFGTRTETKNLNSVRFIGQAIEYEVRRQLALLEQGEDITQETRLFDPTKGETRSMRSKEEAHDYRYFPEPDLPPLKVDASLIDHLRATLPELPDEKKQRFMASFGLKPYEAGVLASDEAAAAYYEAALSATSGWAPKSEEGSLSAEAQEAARLTANWMLAELFALLNKDSLSIDASRISADCLGELVDLIQKGTISGRIAKDIFPEMWETGARPAKIVAEKGLEQVSDDGPIRACIAEIIEANSDKVEQYRDGKTKLFGFFVGQVMKAMAGKANPQLVNDLLKETLG